MTSAEYGDKLIRLGKLMKKPNAKMKDVIAAAFDCGLMYLFRLEPTKEHSVDVVIEEDTP